MGVLGNSVGLGVHELEYIGGSATTAILYVDSHGAAEILNGLDSGVGHLKRWQDVRVSHGHGVSLSTDKATPDLGLAAGRRPGTHASGSLLCQARGVAFFGSSAVDGVPVLGAVKIVPPVGGSILTAPALRQVGSGEEPAAV